MIKFFRFQHEFLVQWWRHDVALGICLGLYTHQDHALADLSAIHFVVRQGVSYQLKLVVRNPLFSLGPVGLLVVQYGFFALMYAGTVSGAGIEVGEV